MSQLDIRRKNVQEEEKASTKVQGRSMAGMFKSTVVGEE